MRGLVAVALVALVFSAPARAHGQLGSAVAGGLAGVAGGGYVTLAIVVARARAGDYLYRPDEADWLLSPLPLGAAAGAAIGADGFDRLGRSALYGALGFAAGTGLGALLGDALSRESEGVWAGAIIGGAAGLAVGAALGALTRESAPEEGGPLLALRVPLGP